VFGGDCLSKEEYEDKWTKLAFEIKRTPSWLRRGETVTIVYGDFEEVETARTDKKTGASYKSKDWKIGVLLRDGSKAWRMIDKYVFVDVMKMFKARAVDGKVPATVVYRRPLRRR